MSGTIERIAPGTLYYECGESPQYPGEWVVEAIDYGSEGEIYAAEFSGHGAKERAEEYAAWKNGHQQGVAERLAG
jgi:hypothetical protein